MENISTNSYERIKYFQPLQLQLRDKSFGNPRSGRHQDQQVGELAGNLKHTEAESPQYSTPVHRPVQRSSQLIPDNLMGLIVAHILVCILLTF